MKSEKEKLAAKSVMALKAAAKRLGGKLVTPDGKAKTKQQLINTIVMKNRLAGKSMGANHTVTAKKPAVKKTMAQKPATLLAEKPYKDLTELRVFFINQLGPTNTMGARVKITDTTYDTSKTVPFGYRGNAASTAKDYLNSLGIKIMARGQDVLISKNFDTRIK